MDVQKKQELRHVSAAIRTESVCQLLISYGAGRRIFHGVQKKMGQRPGRRRILAIPVENGLFTVFFNQFGKRQLFVSVLIKLFQVINNGFPGIVFVVAFLDVKSQ